MSALAFDGTPNNTAVGYFTYTVAEERWTWSDELYSLHGFGLLDHQPGPRDGQQRGVHLLLGLLPPYLGQIDEESCHLHHLAPMVLHPTTD